MAQEVLEREVEQERQERQIQKTLLEHKRIDQRGGEEKPARKRTV